MVRLVWRAIREGQWPAVGAKWEARGAAFAKLGVSIEECSDIVLLTVGVNGVLNYVYWSNGSQNSSLDPMNFAWFSQ